MFCGVGPRLALCVSFTAAEAPRDKNQVCFVLICNLSVPGVCRHIIFVETKKEGGEIIIQVWQIFTTDELRFHGAMLSPALNPSRGLTCLSSPLPPAFLPTLLSVTFLKLETDSSH